MKISQITKLFESFKDAQARFSQDEDEKVVAEYIDQFKHLAKKNIITGPDKDIGKWIKAGWSDFRDLVDTKSTQPSKSDIKRKRVNKSDEVITLIDTDEVTAVIPLTERSSCFYGKNTNWCVSVVSDENMFNNYLSAANFPIHIHKNGETYSIVYSTIKDDVVEVRDSKNEELTLQAMKIEKKIPVDDILSEVKRHKKKLNKMSEEVRLSTPEAAYYYAYYNDVRFEEGEPIIAQDINASLAYMNYVLDFAEIPVIDDSIMEKLPHLEELVKDDQETYIFLHDLGLIFLRKRFIEGNTKWPEKLDIVEFSQTFPFFVFQYIREKMIVVSPSELRFILKNIVKENRNNNSIIHKRRMRRPDITGFSRYINEFDYLRTLHDKGEYLEPYVKVIMTEYDVESMNTSFVKYTVAKGFVEGFTDVVLNTFAVGITDEEIRSILENAVSSELIFKTLLTPDMFSVEEMAEVITINPKVADVIGGIPDKVQKYMDDNGLAL